MEKQKCIDGAMSQSTGILSTSPQQFPGKSNFDLKKSAWCCSALSNNPKRVEPELWEMNATRRSLSNFLAFLYIRRHADDLSAASHRMDRLLNDTSTATHTRLQLQHPRKHTNDINCCNIMRYNVNIEYLIPFFVCVCMYVCLRRLDAPVSSQREWSYTVIPANFLKIKTPHMSGGSQRFCADTGARRKNYVQTVREDCVGNVNDSSNVSFSPSSMFGMAQIRLHLISRFISSAL